MQFRLLGPLDVLDHGTVVDLGGPKQRALLARLLVTPNRAVAVDQLVDDLWGEDVPASAPKMVQIYISHLRKVLPACVIVTRPPGYLAEVEEHAIDSVRFDRLRRAGRAALDAGDADEAGALLREALGLWRGEALAEFDEPFARVERAHLGELRLVCLEDRFDADLARGAHGEPAAELAAEIARHPLRERLRRQAMLALYRSARHADALAVFDDYRRTLDVELGLEPSQELRTLQHQILTQDPALTGDAPGGETPEALEGWAHRARFVGEGEASLQARARAFRGYRARGDARSAARAAAWLA